ncbi:MAG: NADH-quinone oxidoreductase subunit NuoH [Pirellulales bacterium]
MMQVWLVKIGIVMGLILTACAYLIYIERKLAAYMQDRIGPNRVGPFGLLQPLADGLKFILKEDLIPRHADRALFVLAPCIAILTTMLAFAVVPFGPTSSNPDEWQFVIAPGVDIGIVLIFAIGSLAVYSIILGGWASNNKYSLLGALRSSAQVISYEIPLATSVLGVVLMSGSLNLERIIQYQAAQGFSGWNVWAQPLAALIFLVSALAEANRLPFDLPECEQELIGGYHTEYSAMKFAMFFLGEYTHVITVSFLMSVIFFGGWHFPWIAEVGSNYGGAWAAKCAVLAAKVGALIILIMLIRWTVPRFRFDQLMTLAWQGLVPLSFVNVILVMLVKHFSWRPVPVLTIASIALFVGAVALNGAMLQRRIRHATLAIGERHAIAKH